MFIFAVLLTIWEFYEKQKRKKEEREIVERPVGYYFYKFYTYYNEKFIMSVRQYLTINNIRAMFVQMMTECPDTSCK